MASAHEGRQVIWLHKETESVGVAGDNETSNLHLVQAHAPTISSTYCMKTKLVTVRHRIACQERYDCAYAVQEQTSLTAARRRMSFPRQAHTTQQACEENNLQGDILTSPGGLNHAKDGPQSDSIRRKCRRPARQGLSESALSCNREINVLTHNTVHLRTA
eukprot:404792-Amphidinium_carterae.1